jgi:predicted RecB family nuclease
MHANDERQAPQIIALRKDACNLLQPEPTGGNTMTRITSQLLEAYLKCPTKCWLKSVGEETGADTFAQYAQAQNESYRAAETRQLLSRTPQSECMISPSPESIKTDNWRLATGLLARTPHLESHLHAVECSPPERRGKPASMVVIRFISTNKLNSDARLMLAFDALALSEMLGKEVSSGKIIHGDKRATLKVRTSAITLEVRKHVANIAELLSSSSPPDLVLIPHCAECEFKIQCRQKAIERDDLSLLSGMTVKERKKLHDKGIFTVTQLSYTFRPRRRPKKLRDKRDKYYHSLRALAIRQKKIHIIGSPEMTIEGTPVYVDVEGVPDRDFYYLIGVRIGNPDSPVQHSLWADSAGDEMTIWKEFIRILSNVKDPILIHYGSYETVFLKRMGDRYGVPFSESKVKRAMQTSKNVLSTIFAQVYFPTFSNQLKDIGHFLGVRWNGPVLSGFQSLACRLEWEQSLSPELKASLMAYNREDCIAIESVSSHLTKIIREAKSRADVEFSDKPKQIASEKALEIHDSLKSFLKSAHFEYAHSRIKLQAKKPTQAILHVKKRVKSHPLRPALSMMKGSIVRVPRRRVCPKHAGHKLRASSKISRHSLIDLVFSKTGCRKTVVRYTGLMGNCDLCKLSYPPPGVSSLRNQHFGWNFQSWVVYQRVALRMPYGLISKAAFDLFSEQLSPTTAKAYVEKFAGEYQRTEDQLLHNILDGPVVHLDETKISILGADQYVWVLTDNARVVFKLRPSREAAFLHTLLSSFKGVAVTDFYGGYDALPCPQQKCLVHLIRDLNDDLWKNPFDDELEGFVAAFRDLLVPIIEDVQRFGLKARHLRKHRGGVDRFYRDMVTGKASERDTTARFRKRFERYKDSLFSFMEKDDVPWHNNAAERALRHLAVQRKISGSFSEKGAYDYLRLLAIAQTCRFQRKSFLGFLLSRSTNVDEYRDRSKAHQQRSCEKLL